VPDSRRALILGGGIAGLSAALELGTSRDSGPFDEVMLWEADDRLGGKIATSPFGGVDLDEGADAYLLRVPHASGLADEVGLTDIVHPTGATAAVWHDGLHDLPGGMVLGMPAELRPFAASSLLSWRGKLRAAVEPFLPRTDPDDSLGRLVRRRFGNEVHERLVDALVGSIYAADTDRWSLASVPQLAALADGNRSLLLAARAARRRGPASSGPIFGAPAGGMATLVDAVAARARLAGVEIAVGRAASTISADRGVDGSPCWRVDDEQFDAIVIATPAAVAARLLASIAPQASAPLLAVEAADVVMVRLAIAEMPSHLVGRSGYLVPKSDQRFVTAVSFASEKWAHWRPTDGRHLLRVSLGRDGLPVMHLTDDEIVEATLTELGVHLGIDVQPSESSITRWARAFPQYRPHHSALVSSVESALPRRVAIAGASYHGVGIPTCVASGRRAARLVQESTARADESLT
jgi:protoporphyrinogen/coproporphyrinogen III oxidase